MMQLDHDNQDAALTPSPDGFEVATTSSDTLRAGIRVAGSIAPDTVTLLAGVLRTHTVAGRRYLRVDLRRAAVVEPAAADDEHGVLACLVRAHRCLETLGGTLTFVAAPELADTLRASGLHATG